MYEILKFLKRFVPQKIKNIKHLLVAVYANYKSSRPSKGMKVIGVTGTDGKTTTCNILFSILRTAGYETGLISTVNAKIGDKEFDTGYHVTAPDSLDLQKLLRRMKGQGIEYVVLEVTSHGLDQHRFYGIEFDIGLLTNITPEHLDYHKSFENYVQTKAKLFQHSTLSILNKDDDSFERLSRNTKGGVVSYSFNKPSDYKIEDLEFEPPIQKFKINGEEFESSLLGEYNALNTTAAVAAALRLGVEMENVKQGVKEMSPIPGRFQYIDVGQDFSVIVDFAHTSNSLRKVLNLSRKLIGPNAKLISVFGSAGLRDREKRPFLGRAAMELADKVVLTAEDPRTEDVRKIIGEIAEGVEEKGGKEGRDYFRIEDRREAIKFAVNELAEEGDLVLITGKGHEESMCFGEVEYPWSDEDTAQEAIDLKIS